MQKNTNILSGKILAEQDGIIGTFTIGDIIKTSNGVDATVIDYQADSGIDYSDIFLLQDNGTSLVFGLKCQSYTDMIGGRQCHRERPSELNYAEPYIKQ